MAPVSSLFPSADSADIGGRLIASSESNLCLTPDNKLSTCFLKNKLINKHISTIRIWLHFSSPIRQQTGIRTLYVASLKIAQFRPRESQTHSHDPPPSTDLGCQSFQGGCTLWAPLSRDPEALRLITLWGAA